MAGCCKASGASIHKKGLEALSVVARGYANCAKQVRTTFTQFFHNEGELAWQDVMLWYTRFLEAIPNQYVTALLVSMNNYSITSACKIFLSTLQYCNKHGNTAYILQNAHQIYFFIQANSACR